MDKHKFGRMLTSKGLCIGKFASELSLFVVVDTHHLAHAWKSKPILLLALLRVLLYLISLLLVHLLWILKRGILDSAKNLVDRRKDRPLG